MAQRPNVTLRVIPHTAGAPGLTSESFTVTDFSGGENRSVLSQEKSYSAGTGDNRVELMALDGGFAVRDSKFPQLTPQRCTHAESTVFLASVTSGKSDTN